MKRRILLQCLSLGIVAAILVLAWSLQEVKFQPGRSFSAGDAGPNPITLPALQIPSEIPLWKILLLWLAAVVNIFLLFSLLSPELRKKMLRQVLWFAVGILILVIALRYKVIELPAFPTQPATTLGQPLPTPAGGSELPVFHPPQLSPWMAYLASLIALLAILLAARIIYTRWIRKRSPSLLAIAGIAQASLQDLAAGRDWGDVIIESYARMSDAVSTNRGLSRGASVTPREFANRLTLAGLPEDAVSRLTGLFESVRYGGHRGSKLDIQDARDCLNAILRACGAAS